jgi:hypothetical protein
MRADGKLTSLLVSEVCTLRNRQFELLDDELSKIVVARQLEYSLARRSQVGALFVIQQPN